MSPGLPSGQARGTSPRSKIVRIIDTRGAVVRIRAMRLTSFAPLIRRRRHRRLVLAVVAIAGIALLPLAQPGRALATGGNSTMTTLVVTSDTASTSPTASVRGHAVTLTAVVVPVAQNPTR